MRDYGSSSSNITLDFSGLNNVRVNELVYMGTIGQNALATTTSSPSTVEVNDLVAGNIENSNIRIIFPQNGSFLMFYPLVKGDNITGSHICIQLPNTTLQSPAVVGDNASNTIGCIRATGIETDNISVAGFDNASNSTVYVDTPSDLGNQPSYVVKGVCPLAGCYTEPGYTGLPPMPSISAFVPVVKLGEIPKEPSFYNSSFAKKPYTFDFSVRIGSNVIPCPDAITNSKYFGIWLDDNDFFNDWGIAIDLSERVAYGSNLFAVPPLAFSLASNGYLSNTSVGIIGKKMINKFVPPVPYVYLVPAVAVVDKVDFVASGGYIMSTLLHGKRNDAIDVGQFSEDVNSFFGLRPYDLLENT